LAKVFNVLYFFGLALSLTFIIFAKFSGFDRDKNFYPAILIVIAAYYVLFAIISGYSVLREQLIAFVFSHSGVWRI
jgi:hypothetical protein